METITCRIIDFERLLRAAKYAKEFDTDMVSLERDFLAVHAKLQTLADSYEDQRQYITFAYDKKTMQKLIEQAMSRKTYLNCNIGQFWNKSISTMWDIVFNDKK